MVWNDSKEYPVMCNENWCDSQKKKKKMMFQENHKSKN